MEESKVLSAREFLNSIEYETSQINPKLLFFRSFLPTITDSDWLTSVMPVGITTKFKTEKLFKDIVLNDYVIAIYFNFDNRHVFLSNADYVQCMLTFG